MTLRTKSNGILLKVDQCYRGSTILHSFKYSLLNEHNDIQENFFIIVHNVCYTGIPGTSLRYSILRGHVSGLYCHIPELHYERANIVA